MSKWSKAEEGLSEVFSSLLQEGIKIKEIKKRHPLILKTKNIVYRFASLTKKQEIKQRTNWEKFIKRRKVGQKLFVEGKQIIISAVENNPLGQLVVKYDAEGGVGIIDFYNYMYFKTKKV